jgi:hypothetical protein
MVSQPITGKGKRVQKLPEVGFEVVQNAILPKGEPIEETTCPPVQLRAHGARLFQRQIP